jgi:hypothetical protein
VDVRQPSATAPARSRDQSHRAHAGRVERSARPPVRAQAARCRRDRTQHPSRSAHERTGAPPP